LNQSNAPIVGGEGAGKALVPRRRVDRGEDERRVLTPMPRGQFRQSPIDAEPLAYVIMPIGGCFITETVYRARGYAPRFEALPSQEEYEAAGGMPGVEAYLDAEAGRSVEEFETLALAMARYGQDSQAWQDFAADCDRRRIVERDGSRIVIVPQDRWEHWHGVAAGASEDYDENGARTRG
jgi:hypothetical protein